MLDSAFRVIFGQCEVSSKIGRMFIFSYLRLMNKTKLIDKVHPMHDFLNPFKFDTYAVLLVGTILFLLEV